MPAQAKSHPAFLHGSQRPGARDQDCSDSRQNPDQCPATGRQVPLWTTVGFMISLALHYPRVWLRDGPAHSVWTHKGEASPEGRWPRCLSLAKQGIKQAQTQPFKLYWFISFFASHWSQDCSKDWRTQPRHADSGQHSFLPSWISWPEQRAQMPNVNGCLHQQEHPNGKGWGVGEEELHRRPVDVMTRAGLRQTLFIRYHLLIPLFGYTNLLWEKCENKRARYLLSVQHVGPIPV